MNPGANVTKANKFGLKAFSRQLLNVIKAGPWILFYHVRATVDRLFQAHQNMRGGGLRFRSASSVFHDLADAC